MDRAAMFMAALMSRENVHGSDADFQHLAERSLAAVAALERAERQAAGLKSYNEDWNEALRDEESRVNHLVKQCLAEGVGQGMLLPPDWEIYLAKNEAVVIARVRAWLDEHRRLLDLHTASEAAEQRRVEAERAKSAAGQKARDERKAKRRAELEKKPA